MLPRQPLRFLLADDPEAGKTIMADLLIRELIARGDLQRCLVVCPGSLAQQWPGFTPLAEVKLTHLAAGCRGSARGTFPLAAIFNP
jgi:hypothetical protein